MTLTAEQLVSNVDIIERVEKSTLRMVTQALLDFVDEAREIFSHETDSVADLCAQPRAEALVI